MRSTVRLRRLVGACSAGIVCIGAPSDLRAERLPIKAYTTADGLGHNVVNRALLASVLGLPMSRARHLHQENCCINILEYGPESTKLVTLNAVLHLH